SLRVFWMIAVTEGMRHDLVGQHAFVPRLCQPQHSIGSADRFIQSRGAVNSGYSPSAGAAVDAAAESAHGHVGLVSEESVHAERAKAAAFGRRIAGVAGRQE